MIPDSDLRRIAEELGNVACFLDVRTKITQSSINHDGNYCIDVAVTANDNTYNFNIVIPFYYEESRGWLKTIILHSFLSVKMVDDEKITLTLDTLLHMLKYKRAWRVYYGLPINGKLRRVASAKEVEYVAGKICLELKLETGRKIKMYDIEVLRRYLIIERKEWREVQHG